MFKVGDLNGNTNQTVAVNYDKGSETIPITEGNKWYVHNIPSGKSLYNFEGIKEITDTIISAKFKKRFQNPIIENVSGNLSLVACDISECTNMSWVFDRCGVSSLDVSSLNTSNVTGMARMFSACKSLQSLDLSTFDTSNVTDMTSMFAFDSSLKSLDLSHFDTSNVTKMAGMFRECDKLQSLDLSHFDTSNVTDMNYMFAFDYFQSLDLSTFDTSNVTDMSHMFSFNRSLQVLNISGWDLTNVKDTTDMFNFCFALKTIIMRGCNQTTIDKIKAALEEAKLKNVTIITE
jgi:surface protein